MTSTAWRAVSAGDGRTVVVGASRRRGRSGVDHRPALVGGLVAALLAAQLADAADLVLHGLSALLVLAVAACVGAYAARRLARRSGAVGAVAAALLTLLLTHVTDGFGSARSRRRRGAAGSTGRR